MPERETIERAEEDKREGKSPSTQAREFVREEIHHVREGKHGARSPQEAIAIGLSKARRAGVKLNPPKGPALLKKKLNRTPKRARRRTKCPLSGHEGSKAPSNASPTAQPVIRRYHYKLKRQPQLAASKVEVQRRRKRLGLGKGRRFG
jgi:hypothetical protein